MVSRTGARGGRTLLLILAVHGAGLSQQGAPRDAPPSAKRPNIVFLLTDDQSTDSLGCYGNPDVQTPHLDALARDGVVFDNHYVTTAICMASRATIMTGRFEYRHGCNFGHGALLRSHWQNSYPVLLRKAGYQTAIAGKIGFTVADRPGGRGELPKADFDAWGAGPGQTHYETAKNPAIVRYAKEFPHSTRAYGAFGRDFIRRAAGAGKPFCLSISFKAPHRPTTPDPAFDAVYRGKKFRKPANYGRKHGAHFSEQSRRGRQFPRFESWGYADRYDQVMAVYHQQIYAIDVAVGMIRGALREHGVADNTVIVFTSDNGFFCGAHGYGSKVLPYEEASRVPLIVYDPREEKRTLPEPRASGEDARPLRRRTALTGSVDFAPTFLELAGVPPLESMDGRDLLPIYRDGAAPGHRSLPLINVWGPAPTHSLAVVTETAKLIFWGYGGEGMTPTEEFYRLDDDPLELRNLARHPDHQQQLRALRRLHGEWTEHWRQEAVPAGDYARFGRLFDLGRPWAERRKSLGKPAKRR